MGPDDLKRLFTRQVKKNEPTPSAGPSATRAPTKRFSTDAVSEIADIQELDPQDLTPLPTHATSTDATILTVNAATPRTESRTVAPVMGQTTAHDLHEKLGAGGMGTVYRVKDQQLGRNLAMKVIHTQLKHGETLSRFVEEAQLTSQLEHPAIVPVHSMGYLPDGRVYFTMKEIKGRTFTKVIQELHAACNYDRWETTPGGWTFHKVLDAFHRSVEAIAYAHNRGVIHRDLKPSNIMVGEFGEVLVVDWGLAKIWGEAEDHPIGEDMPDVTSAWRSGGGETLYGSIAGTPAYMAPEQVLGATDKMCPATDVYALGSMLYHILSGAPPFRGKKAMAIMKRVVEEDIPPFDEDTCSRSPQSLRDLAMWCLKKEHTDRPKDAMIVAQELADFLAGAKQREAAKKLVAKADALLPAIQQKRQNAETLRSDARTMLTDIAASDPIAMKLPAWKKEDKAKDIEKDATTQEVAYIQALAGALSLDPTLQEAHRRLAAFYVAAHRRAERRGNWERALEYAALIKVHDARNRYAGYLDGEGMLTLTTDPPEAEVLVFRYEEKDRQLALQPMHRSQLTPLSRMVLPMGSYRLEIRYPGRSLVQYPLKMSRQDTQVLRRPGSRDAFAIPIPPLDFLGPESAYIAPGYFECGGDRDAPGSMPGQQVWVDGFVLAKRPVSNGDYARYLNDLVKMGRFEEAVRHAPRPPGAKVGDRTALYYGLQAMTGFSLTAGAHPTLANPDAPVCGIGFLDAMAYAGWLAGQTGINWRIPGELEIEKASRGADGRHYAWGNFADPAWACCYDSHLGEAAPGAIGSFRGDESPFLVKDLAGNMGSWCLDRWHPQGPALSEGRYELPGFFDASAANRVGDSAPRRKVSPERVIRGGAWNKGIERLRAASRDRLHPDSVSDSVGIRLAYSMS